MMSSQKKLKNGDDRTRPKPKYKVKNWSEYNKSLINRGKISFYFPAGDIKSQFINDSPYIKGISGQGITYKKPYIEFIFLVYRLFGWGIRQTTGYIEDLWKMQGLEMPVPSFGHLSDLFSTISIEVKQHCNSIKRKVESGEEIEIIADSTGLKFGKASQWYEEKYNKSCERRPWRKLHISIDSDMNIHESIITEDNVSDKAVIDNLIPSDIKMNKLIADGAYYCAKRVEELYKRGIIPAIPPPSNATTTRQKGMSWHNKIVEYIENKGSKYAFFAKYGYGRRELVEAQNSRIKRCIGDSLLVQKELSQKNEGKIIANIINIWNSFGMCNSVKIV